MNLNQKFKNHFLAASSLPLSGEAVSFFDEVAKTYLQNFKPSYGAGFNHEQIDLITEKSATLWAEKFKLLANDTSLDQTTVLRKAWQEVVTDFHRNNQWNLKAGEKASAPPVQTELQKNHKELRSYIVVLIQVAILMKMVIYTFGLQYSNNPDEPIYKYLFFTFVSFSFFNMWFFVWRKRTKNNKNKLHEPNQ